MRMQLIYVGIFGLLGVFTRFFLGSTFERTFLINILGSFLMGIVYVLSVEKAWFGDDLRIGLMVGFLGGFTTFSSFSLDTFRLFEEARYSEGLYYFMGSPMVGLLVLWMAAMGTRWVVLR